MERTTRRAPALLVFLARTLQGAPRPYGSFTQTRPLETPPRHCPLALRHAHAKGERENCATARKVPKNQPLGTLFDLMVSSETTSVVEHTLDLQGNWKQHLFPFGSAPPFK